MSFNQLEENAELNKKVILLQARINMLDIAVQKLSRELKESKAAHQETLEEYLY